MLQKLRRDLRFDLEVLDEDADSVLDLRYGKIVPLLAMGDEIICNYHLDTAKLRVSLI